MMVHVVTNLHPSVCCGSACVTVACMLLLLLRCQRDGLTRIIAISRLSLRFRVHLSDCILRGCFHRRDEICSKHIFKIIKGAKLKAVKNYCGRWLEVRWSHGFSSIACMVWLCLTCKFCRLNHKTSLQRKNLSTCEKTCSKLCRAAKRNGWNLL